MRKALFVFLILVNSLFASFTLQSNYSKEIRILKSFDIDESFLVDPVFIYMKNQLNRYRTKHFLEVLQDGYTFMPILTRMISESHIPRAFLYLAMAESSFSAKARSSSRAEGLWQFMPQTAKLLGLKVNRYIDERRDPIKSTKIAIKYLKFLHKEFGKWYLAALAYNCGEGTLRRLIKRVGTDKLSVLLDSRKKYLPKESRLYLRKILAMAYLSNNDEFITKNDAQHLVNRGSTFSLSSVKVPGGVTLQSIADSIGISLKELKRYNPQFRYYFTPPYDKKYTVYIPYDKTSLFKRKFKPNKKHGRFEVYYVKKGDSLYKIGKRFGVSYQVIKDFNHLKSNILRIHAKLIIPNVKPRFIKYTIKKGDTLYTIARRFKVNMKKIVKANNLKSTILRPGAKIVIPN